MASKNPVSKSIVSTSTRPGSITVTVTVSGDGVGVMSNALVSVYPALVGTDCNTFQGQSWQPPAGTSPVQTGRTDRQGQVTFPGVPPGCYVVKYEHHPLTDAQCVAVGPGCAEAVCFQLALDVDRNTRFQNADGQNILGPQPRVGDRAYTTVGFNGSFELQSQVELVIPRGAVRDPDNKYAFTTSIRNAGPQQLVMALQFAALTGPPGTGPIAQPAGYGLDEDFDADRREPTPISGNLNVSLSRTETEPTSDLRLWGAIRASSDALSFDNYLRFMDLLFCDRASGKPGTAETTAFDRLLRKRFLPFTDTDAYRVMKAATEAFVIVNCGVFTGASDLDGEAGVLGDLLGYLDRRDLPGLGREPYLENVDGIRMLPYLAIIRRKLPDVAFNGSPRGTDAEADLCEGFVQEKLRNPCLLELIWSYWHEEGMQVQTMNAITRRFQNVRSVGRPDPLANMEVNPLRPLNNLLWGYIQDEQHRLTVARRNGEYHHHYGLQLEGRAVQGFRPADSRSKFIEAFHHLLRLCTEFYKQDDDTTVKADAFGVLNALKEVHLIISQGAHSQFGDLPPTARIEMLMQQWLLSRAEFREFLPTRVMVAYPEPWMDRVDAMKTLQDWTDTSVMHFHNLAVFGEQILLSIRYGAWSVVFEPTQAFNFARFWRPQIQGYIHAYRAATGAELGTQTVDARVDATMPSVLLQKRLVAQQRSA
jgi:hypothetical protein